MNKFIGIYPRSQVSVYKSVGPLLPLNLPLIFLSLPDDEGGITFFCEFFGTNGIGKKKLGKNSVILVYL